MRIAEISREKVEMHCFPVYITAMKTDGRKDRTYMEILAKLRHLIAAEYKEGGRLPPSREMCARFGVSLPTYGKAVARLLADGSAYRDSNKGIVVQPEILRHGKIGVVIGKGSESPGIWLPDVFGELLTQLQNHQFYPQLIQAPEPELLIRRALSHGLDALLCYQALPIPAAKTIMRENFPFLILNSKDPDSAAETEIYSCNCIHHDYRDAGPRRARILLERGHRRIAYIGNPWFAEYTGFISTIRESGAELCDDLPLYTEQQIRTNLTALLRRNRITALYSEGGGSILHLVFRILAELPAEDSPELLVTKCDVVPYLRRKYPSVRCIGQCGFRTQTLPRIAAEMLADHLNSGTPLRSRAIPSFLFDRAIQERD